MKKRDIVILLVALLLISLFVFSSCDKDHKHEYGDWTISKAATCTETGQRTRKCECGEEQTETIPATGHNFVDGICTDCGAKQ